MEENFIKYFGSISHMYCFAIIFDPTKKLPGLQIGMKGISECLSLDYSEAFTHVKEEFFSCFSHVSWQIRQQREIGGLTTDATRKDKLDIPLVKEAKGQVQFFVLSVSDSPKWNYVSELNNYLQHDFANIDPDLSGGGKIDFTRVVEEQ